MDDIMDDLGKLLLEAGKSAQKIGMTAAEKSERRAEVMSFMEKAVHLPLHPLPRPRLARQENLWRSLWSRINPAYIATPLVLAGLGAGVVYGAENSLPGDFLYPVKTQVIEKVQTSLAPTPKAKAVLHAQFALKRLEEMEKIKQRRVLQAEDLDKLSVDFDQHNAELQSDLKSLHDAHQEDSATEISTDFSTRLTKHQPLINVLKMRAEFKRQHLNELREGARSEVDTTVEKTISPRLPILQHRIRPFRQSLEKVRVVPAVFTQRIIRPPSTHEAGV